jgi:xanthine/uracil/vitamin C permease (AzgA family)
MEDFEFNFKEKDYLIFIQLIEKKSTIGIIVLNKTGLIELSDFEKENYLKNIFGL